jgi:hypothetical protein
MRSSRGVWSLAVWQSVTIESEEFNSLRPTLHQDADYYE